MKHAHASVFAIIKRLDGVRKRYGIRRCPYNGERGLALHIYCVFFIILFLFYFTLSIFMFVYFTRIVLYSEVLPMKERGKWVMLSEVSK